jgi:GT2 family glycosyltransferase
MSSTEVRVPRVTLAVLNYNGRELLDIVMPSVLALDGAGDARVMVVDNGSEDGSCGHVHDRWPDVEVLEIPENIGVAAALNRALAASDSEFVALLNNDIELERNWLGELIGALDAHPEAASASGKLLRFDDRATIDAAGDLMLWSGAVINRGYGMPDDGRFDSPQAVFAACAGAALYRRSAFDLVGPFDESFFAYLEDIDWGVRAQLAGLSSRYVPAAVGYHMGGATTRRRKGFYGRLQRRNTLLLVAKDFPLDALLRHGWKITVNQGLWLAASARDGMLLEHLRAWGELAARLPEALRARRVIQGSRVISTRELSAVIDASLPWRGSYPERLLFELAPLQASRRMGARV